MNPLQVAGVAGGVGTSTLTRLLYLLWKLPVADLGVYHPGLPLNRPVDLLVTSNHAAATARIGPVLGTMSHRPVLVVMNTATGVVDDSRAQLRKAMPHVCAVFEINHRRAWLEMPAAPGSTVAKTKDIVALLDGLPAAITAMYPVAPPSHGVRPMQAAPVAVRQSPLVPRAGPAIPQWRPQGGAPQGFGRGSHSG